MILLMERRKNMKSYDDFLKDFGNLLESYCIETYGTTLDEILKEEKDVRERKIERLGEKFISELE